MARYMLIMRSTPEAEAAMEELNIDFSEIIESMGRFNEELIKAGVMLAGEGLTGPEDGFVVDFDPTRRWSPTVPTPRPRSCSTGSGSSTCLEGRGQAVGAEDPARQGRQGRGAPGVRDRRVSAGQPVDPEGDPVEGRPGREDRGAGARRR